MRRNAAHARMMCAWAALGQSLHAIVPKSSKKRKTTSSSPRPATSSLGVGSSQPVDDDAQDMGRPPPPRVFSKSRQIEKNNKKARHFDGAEQPGTPPRYPSASFSIPLVVGMMRLSDFENTLTTFLIPIAKNVDIAYTNVVKRPRVLEGGILHSSVFV